MRPLYLVAAAAVFAIVGAAPAYESSGNSFLTVTENDIVTFHGDPEDFEGFDDDSDLATDFALKARQTPKRPCTRGVHVIAASGDGANNIGGYGLLATLATNITAAIPHSNNVTLPYPKGDSNKVSSLNKGSKRLTNWISKYHNACPDSKFVLLGYSAGAIITMNTLCGGTPPWSQTALFPDFASSIVAIVTYGDETRVAGQDYNEGGCTGNGRFPRRNPDGCGSFKPALRSYCLPEDPQCCSGFVPEQHFIYPQRFDIEATQWVVEQYEAATGKDVSKM